MCGVIPFGDGVASVSGNIVVPATISGAGAHAVRSFLNFFAATIRNRNTREAYYRATCSFFAWLEQHDIGASRTIRSGHDMSRLESRLTRRAHCGV